MNKKELTRLLPENGAGAEGLRELKDIGYPTIEPITKSLLNYLGQAEINETEIGKEVISILGLGGDHIAPPVSEILSSDQQPQKRYALLAYVLPLWSTEQLKPLENIIYSYLDS